MSHLEPVMTWFNQIRRSDDAALRRIERLGQDLHEAPDMIIPLFFAKKAPGS
jgi:hypothetical protein